MLCRYYSIFSDTIVRHFMMSHIFHHGHHTRRMIEENSNEERLINHTLETHRRTDGQTAKIRHVGVRLCNRQKSAETDV